MDGSSRRRKTNCRAEIMGNCKGDKKHEEQEEEKRKEKKYG